MVVNDKIWIRWYNILGNNVNHSKFNAYFGVLMLSLIYGGITHHFIGSNLPYCGRINDSGTIHHEYVIAMAGTSTAKIGLIKGKDSACGNILGPISSFSLSENVEFLAGGYNTNFKEFEKLGIRPPSISGFTPVLGLDFRIPIYQDDDIKFSIDNLVSLGIITHALRVDF